MSIPGDSPLTESSRKHHTNVGLMTQTNKDSLTETAPPFQKALRELAKYAERVVLEYSENDWLPAMRNQSAHLKIDLDVRDDQLNAYLDAAKRKSEAPSVEANMVYGGQKFTWREVKDVMPGFFKENLLHLINAEQGAGKSTLMLGLFRALISDQQPASFLNVEVDSSTNWHLFLIAPDMPRESWSVPLENYGFLSAIAKGVGKNEAVLDSRITFAGSEVPLSLRPDDVLQYRQMALDSVAKGRRPLFVFDSYSTLVANFKDMNEIDSQFAQPLQNLQKAMAGSGATVIVLHHTAKSRSGSTASSGSGTNRLGRIPDVVIELEATTRNSKRLFMTSSKRVKPSSLIIEQDFDAGQWICHGDAKQAMELRDLLQKIDGLKGPKEKIYEWAQQRWEDQRKGFTCEDVQRLIERSVQAARTHVRVMEANGVIFQCDSIPTPGRYQPVYLPTEYREEWVDSRVDYPLGKTAKPLENLVKTAESTAAQAKETWEGKERGKAGEGLECERKETLRKQIIPCHPVGTAVEYNGKNGWKVVEANLASGMHVIEKNGLRHKDLRKMDLPVHIDPEEEL